jgi:predicted nucleic acid-binding Zn ribbon protein
MAETRSCIQCGKELKMGTRVDAKFCGENCRAAHNNKLKNEESAEIKKIKLALIKNRRVLRLLLGKNQELIVSKEALLKAGFEFDYHTHHVISKFKTNEYIFSFNYGYHLMPDGQYKIVKSFK